MSMKYQSWLTAKATGFDIDTLGKNFSLRQQGFLPINIALFLDSWQKTVSWAKLTEDEYDDENEPGKRLSPSYSSSDSKNLAKDASSSNHPGRERLGRRVPLGSHK